MFHVPARWIAVVLLAGALGAGLPLLVAQTVPVQTAPAQPAQPLPPQAAPSTTAAPSHPPMDIDSPAEAKPGDVAALPPPPAGKSTVVGGEIKNVDPVRDILTLKIVGEKPMKIFFDQRTKVFLDGKPIPLVDLKAADHAAVQTLLDGTDVYALSIHMLSHSPEGDYQGTILSYNAATTELTVTSDLSHAPTQLLVPAGTPVTRQGQEHFRSGQRGIDDLIRGSLITVKFASNLTGGAVASQISILAVPGAEFTYIGNLTNLDLHSGKIALVDPRDNHTYQLVFDPASMRNAETFRIGQHVMVTAVFDGAKYIARSITPD